MPKLPLMMPMAMHNMIAERMVRIPLSRRALSIETCCDRKVYRRWFFSGSEVFVSSVTGVSTSSVRVSVPWVVGVVSGSSDMMSTCPPLPCGWFC